MHKHTWRNSIFYDEITFKARNAFPFIPSRIWFVPCNSWPGQGHQRNYFPLPNVVPAHRRLVLGLANLYSGKSSPYSHGRFRSRRFRDTSWPTRALQLCTLRRLRDLQAEIMNLNQLKGPEARLSWNSHLSTPLPNYSTCRPRANHRCHGHACTH